MGLVNPHTSMVFHDPYSKDHNKFEQLSNKQEKTRILLEHMREWKGKQLHVVNVMSGEVRVWEIKLNAQGKVTRHGRVNCLHLLFGNWRVATAEDIQRQVEKDKVQADHIARAEANKAATKAGIMFSELAKASKAINEFQALQEASKAAAVAVETEKKETETKGEKKSPKG